MTTKKVETVDKFVYTVPEYERYDRSIIWYGVILILFALSIFYAIRLQDIRLAVVIVFGSIIFYQLALADPKNTELILKPTGIIFRGIFHPWTDFKAFSLAGSDQHMTAHLERFSSWQGQLVITLPLHKEGQNMSPRMECLEVIRSIIPERLHQHFSLSEFFVRFIRF